MAEQDFRFERHCELWKDQNRQVARWAFGTVIFATILLWRVLVPYTDLSDRVAAKQAEAAKAQAELAGIEADRAALAKVGDGLERLRAAIERQPWMAEKDRLIGSLRDLNRAHRALVGASPGQVAEALRASRGNQMAQQASQVPADPRADAAALLRIDADRLGAVPSAGAYHRLLDERLGQRVQEEADDKVRRIVAGVEGEIIQPLERLLRENSEAKRALPSMVQLLARLRADMGRWAQQHIGNRTWYETIQLKDQELRELTEGLRQRQEALIGLLREQRQALEGRRAALAERRQQAQEQATALGKAVADLSGQMQKLLPDFVRDLVSPEEMISLYPLVLLGLVGILTFKVGLLRHHYLFVRDGHRLQGPSLRDSAVSSPWTLVYRGPLGTTITAALFLGGTLFLWWLYERGSVLQGAWLAGHANAPWAGARVWLPALRWVGRIVFSAALLCIARTLRKDYAASPGRPAAVGVSRPIPEHAGLIGGDAR